MRDDRTVAVIGTGIMGGAMARNLARAGFAVRVWNRSPQRTETATAAGATALATPAEAIEGAGLVITMLADAQPTVEVMADALPADPGLVWVQMGTVGLAGNQRCAALAAERGVAFVDAPVSGTKQPAEQGQLVVLASGPGPALERCQPVFDIIGRQTLQLGEAGRGSRMKLVLNSWVTAFIGALAETLALAEGLGVDPSSFLQAIDGGPLGAPYAQIKGSAMTSANYPASFPLQLAAKDVHLVLEAAEGADLELRIMRATGAAFDAAVSLGRGDDDMAAVYEATRPGRTPA